MMDETPQQSSFRESPFAGLVSSQSCDNIIILSDSLKSSNEADSSYSTKPERVITRSLSISDIFNETHSSTRKYCLIPSTYADESALSDLPLDEVTLPVPFQNFKCSFDDIFVNQFEGNTDDESMDDEYFFSESCILTKSVLNDLEQTFDEISSDSFSVLEQEQCVSLSKNIPDNNGIRPSESVHSIENLKPSSFFKNLKTRNTRLTSTCYSTPKLSSMSSAPNKKDCSPDIKEKLGGSSMLEHLFNDSFSMEDSC